MYDGGFSCLIVLSGNVHVWVSSSLSGSEDLEPSRFREKGTSDSGLPFWMEIIAVGGEFVCVFGAAGVGWGNISQPDEISAIDWFDSTDSLSRQSMFSSFISSVSDLVGDEFFQQTASRTFESDSIVICSVVPVSPDFVR